MMKKCWRKLSRHLRRTGSPRWSRTPFNKQALEVLQQRPAYMSHLFLSTCQETISHHNWFINCSMIMLVKTQIIVALRFEKATVYHVMWNIQQTPFLSPQKEDSLSLRIKQLTYTTALIVRG